jgi:F-type H+-transporting ATPase subunit gamma
VASLKTIRKRITSTKATQKITKAMKMVAGARLARAQQRIVSMRPYALKTAEVLQGVASSINASGADSATSDDNHPLLARRAEKTVLFLVLTSDRGLCGAFNTNILKATERAWKEKEAAGVTVKFATVGRKGREYLARRKGDNAQDFVGIYDALDLEKARIVATWIVQRFDRGEVDAIYIVYNEFKSAITQKLSVEKLLPLDEAPATATTTSKDAAIGATEFLFEPDKRALLDRLVPMYIEISVLRALLESQASEFGARMTAMDAATRNAKDMIAKLTLVYNRVRQAAITKELMEIIGGAEALKE